MSELAWLNELNPQQRAAVTHGDGPLLIIAGAGTGKTKTLAARVAWLLERGVSAERILLLTFTRRAAQEMLRRAAQYASHSTRHAPHVWGGTFHAVANRLLRQHGHAVGLTPDFTVLDQSDAEDLLNLVRQEMGLHSREKRFPKKGTLLEIYSKCVNSQQPLDKVVPRDFPWCSGFDEEMARLFATYTDRKQQMNVLDYDDLLLFWFHLMRTAEAGARAAERFDHILVDEYQDTNKLQADVLRAMAAAKRNITVVGDDAQSIYGFRAATVRNILDFPKQFPGATVITLEQNYRSVQPILDAANAVIARARQRFTKNLWSERRSEQRPLLVSCVDEAQQCRFVCTRILEQLEAGVPLRRQAVLVRTGHWSDMLEVEMSRRNIPYRKFGGLKFLEAAHVKDLLALLRLLENPRDQVSWLRVLNLLPGVGGATANGVLRFLAANNHDFRSLAHCSVPTAARERFRALAAMLTELAGQGVALSGDLPDSSTRLGPAEAGTPNLARERAPEPGFGVTASAGERLLSGPHTLSAQIERIRKFYEPVFHDIYDHAEVRIRDLEQLAAMAASFGTREEFLSDVTLDPPSGTSDWAGAPHKDEEWMTISTIHSAKGCEWDVVFLIHATDGVIPSDLTTGNAVEIEEERRLLYVAMTRARNWLYVCFPLRYYADKHVLGDRHSYAQLTRFIPSDVRALFEQVTLTLPKPVSGGRGGTKVETNARAKIRSLWSQGS
ncbi:MAG: ATP-dependent helicase [Verrucomicrobiia bacterium]|jgi:DNA helicase-2/ATP-dependent DNA helicase PcrA